MNNFIDLFSGAGGLSEGFIKAGYSPIAHVEIDKFACDTLKTRAVYHYLKKHNQESLDYDYLHNKISRDELWNSVPKEIIEFLLSVETEYYDTNQVNLDLSFQYFYMASSKWNIKPYGKKLGYCEDKEKALAYHFPLTH